MKEDTQLLPPVELGTFTTKGRRTDITHMYNLLKKGATPNEIMEAHPDLYIKYHKAIDRVFNNIAQSREGRYRKVTVKVLHGAAGTGKTRMVYDTHGTENVYRLNQSNSSNIWFDGYTNQKVLLIDDFYGWIRYGSFLQLLDAYFIRLEKKGGFVYSNWDTIYITSNVHPREWYTKGFTPALSRRISEISHFELDESTTFISTPVEKSYIVKNNIPILVENPFLESDAIGSSCGIVLPATLVTSPPDSGTSAKISEKDEENVKAVPQLSPTNLVPQLSRPNNLGSSNNLIPSQFPSPNIPNIPINNSSNNDMDNVHSLDDLYNFLTSDLDL